MAANQPPRDRLTVTSVMTPSFPSSAASARKITPLDDGEQRAAAEFSQNERRSRHRRGECALQEAFGAVLND